MLLSPKLAEAAENHNLLPFIGAGFSKNIDPKFPDWAQLMPYCAKMLGYDPDILEQQGSYMQIAEFMGIRGQLKQFYNDMSKLLDGAGHKVSVSPAHLLLPYVDTPHIFTTNWDHWIEEGFRHEGIPHCVTANQRNFMDPHIVPGRRTRSPKVSHADRSKHRSKFELTNVIKFHGDFSDQDSIVFKESDYYNRLSFDHPSDIRFRSEILSRSVIFFGYSFSDPNVRYIWHKLHLALASVPVNDRFTSFFVTHQHTPLQGELLKSKNIEVVLLEPNDLPAQVEQLFTLILEKQKA